MIELLDLYDRENSPRAGAALFLYELMAERLEDPHVNISHTEMPVWDEHIAFLASVPYRAWMLIAAHLPASQYAKPVWVGYVSATRVNEIGIVIQRKWRGQGYGSAAVRKFIQTFQPLPAVRSYRTGAWVANINPANEPSQKMFQKLGFQCIQTTYQLPEEGTHGNAQEIARTA